MPESLQTTYSFWQSYRNCPRACAWRYLDELAPIERSMNLRVGTLVHRCLECTLLKSYPRAYIVVEGSLEDVLQGRYTSRAHPQSILAITASLMTRYGIPVLFAADRPGARALVEELLVQWSVQQENV